MKKIVVNLAYGGHGWTTTEAAQRYKEISGKEMKKAKIPFFDEKDIYLAPDRADPAWVQVVEELGPTTSDEFSFYSVIEIDEENFDYEITEHDGQEGIRLIPIIDVDKIIGKTEEEVKKYLDFLNIKYKGGTKNGKERTRVDEEKTIKAMKKLALAWNISIYDAIRTMNLWQSEKKIKFKTIKLPAASCAIEDQIITNFDDLIAHEKKKNFLW